MSVETSNITGAYNCLQQCEIQSQVTTSSPHTVVDLALISKSVTCRPSFTPAFLSSTYRRFMITFIDPSLRPEALKYVSSLCSEMSVTRWT